MKASIITFQPDSFHCSYYPELKTGSSGDTMSYGTITIIRIYFSGLNKTYNHALAKLL